MENIRNLFNEHGYSLLVHPEDDKSFYCCLYSIIQGDKHPVNAQNAYQMQKDIFEYEKRIHCIFTCLNLSVLIATGTIRQQTA